MTKVSAEPTLLATCTSLATGSVDAPHAPWVAALLRAGQIEMFAQRVVMREREPSLPKCL